MRTSAVSLLLASVLVAGCSGSSSTTSQAPPPSQDAGQPAPADTGSRATGVEPGAALTDSGKSAPAGRGLAPHPPDAPAAPKAPPAPRFREVTLPAGTNLALKLETAVASDTSAVEDAVRASLRRDVVVDQSTVIPAGADVRGVVTRAERSGKMKGRANIAFRFTELVLGDETYDIRTSLVTRQARGTKKKDAAKIGIGAGAGAVIGGIVGGGKGAAVGTAVGGGAGTGMVLATRGEEIRLAAGTPVTVTLAEPVMVRVAVAR